MAISGTIPHFHHGLAPSFGSPTVVTVTGTTTGLADGTHSTESIQAFYSRVQVALGGISGVVAVSGVAAEASGVIITSAQLSGLRAMQREVAMRHADIEFSFEANGPRLAEARRVLASNGGEIKFPA